MQFSSLTDRVIWFYFFFELTVICTRYSQFSITCFHTMLCKMHTYSIFRKGRAPPNYTQAPRDLLNAKKATIRIWTRCYHALPSNLPWSYISCYILFFEALANSKFFETLETSLPSWRRHLTSITKNIPKYVFQNVWQNMQIRFSCFDTRERVVR